MNKQTISRRKGYSLAELCIAMVLMTSVLFLAVALLNLSTKAMLGTELQNKIVRQDSEFAAQLNETVREAGTAFTIPARSFVESNLTQGWNYLGLMDGVHIPAFCSRTGKEITSAQALVYIEYAGSTPPATVPANANLLNTADGYFIQYVLAHAFVDQDGIQHEYSLTFQPTDPTQTADQTIAYEFTSTLTDAAGNPVGSGEGIDIDTMLSSLNAIQVVYKGSATNPAVALAFRSDFLPTYSVGLIRNNQPSATVTLVLDLSGSMDTSFGAGTRVSALKESAINFVEELSKNDKVNICLIPFSSFGTNQLNYRGGRPSRFVYNAANDKDELIAAIQNLKSIGGTNVGDGLRCAYYELESLKSSGTDMGTNFLILMTDGAMNTWTVNGNTASRILEFYTGTDSIPPYIAYHAGSARTQYIETGSWFSVNNTLSHSVDTRSIFSSAEDVLERGARAYMRLWANEIMTEFNATTYLISLCNGMSAGDQAALQLAFNTTDVFDVNSLTDFQNTFEQINDKINEVMWAFEGPRL